MRFCPKFVALFSLVTLATLGSTAARAATIDLYHLGEADSPVGVNGGAGNNLTIDSGPGGHNLTIAGSPTYSNNVAAPGSTLSMNFAPADSYSNASVVTNLATNVGISAWVFPTATSDGLIAYNGNGGSSGFGLLEYNGFGAPPAGTTTVFGLLGGNSFGPGAFIPLNAWTELTQFLVGTQDELFVNGVLVGSVTASASTPSGTFEIGGGFTGNIDEVRVFTPEPSSLILCGLGTVGLFVAARRRRKA